jgi:EAL domain-containing protein (putative c-di-GMP-specific phosphodiesterase class I)
MAYQPLVDVHKKSVLGYEALLRSSSTVLRGALEVIDAAERLDSLPQLGRRIRRAVVTTIGGAQLNGWSIFVNVHPLELSDDELLDPASPLAAHARQVVLEVTERFALDRVDRLAERVEHLRRLGYRLAIDDLGAGYASLNSFAQLQPDFVKLDMALVHHAPGDSMRRRLIRSMVQVCDELGIQVVAEGVETVEQRDTLMRLGCRVMQGYLFARPAPSFPLVSW